VTIRVVVPLVDEQDSSIGVRIDSDAASAVYVYSWEAELHLDRALPDPVLTALR